MSSSAKYVVCPTCGAVSIAGGPCEYCGTQLVVKDDTATYEERIVSRRTISPVAFAQKISIFKKVGEYIGNCSVVSIGKLHGVINLNGDVIIPLEYSEIILFKEGYAIMDKGREGILFDLTTWKRITTPFSPFSYIDFPYVYVLGDYIGFSSSKRSYRIIDRNGSLLFDGYYGEHINTGVILSEDKNRDNWYNWRCYFDKRVGKTFYCPRASDLGFEELDFTGRDHKLALEMIISREIRHEVVLDIDGKSADGIQEEIDRAIEEGLPILQNAIQERERKNNMIKFTIFASIVVVLIMILAVVIHG